MENILRRTKFGNTRTIVAGEIYHSKREAARHPQLRLLEKAGRIRDLRRQVKYRLEFNDVLIATYTADYVYEEHVESVVRLVKGERAHVTPDIAAGGLWRLVVEDVKGYPNDRWPMKKKLMKACHGIVVLET